MSWRSTSPNYPSWAAELTLWCSYRYRLKSATSGRQPPWQRSMSGSTVVIGHPSYLKAHNSLYLWRHVSCRSFAETVWWEIAWIQALQSESCLNLIPYRPTCELPLPHSITSWYTSWVIQPTMSPNNSDCDSRMIAAQRILLSHQPLPYLSHQLLWDADLTPQPTITFLIQ